ncbi:Retrovirus-related Pol polyprotein from transposon gypsy, partial [Mucuna pruriens]
MHPHDEEKTTFIMDADAFYYKVMPFSLKNAGATYQRLMDKIFKEVMGVDVEVYVNDMVVKFTVAAEHCKALKREASTQAKSREMLIWSPYWKILGFMLTERGIEANLEKCQAVIGMRNP